MLVFKKALANQTAQNIGNPTHLHTYTYIKDFGRFCVFLAQQDSAYGQIRHAPNNPTVSTKDLIDLIYQDL
jgi:nucleoside-diphosphate-sugar epimerase